MTTSENVTADDLAAFKAMAYKHTTACKVCGEVVVCAGMRRSDMRCIEDFAKKRHRRIGQLRAAVRRETREASA